MNNIGNLMKDLDNFELNKGKINSLIDKFTKIKKIEPNHPFFYALEEFKKKLFNEERNKKGFINIIPEFKPGIIIAALIRGANLILKNIATVKTENLERLNEALTGNKKITLNEDIQNSFTKESNKEIIFNSFRIIATCNEGEEASLSEAFLSRFTLIYVKKYTQEEEIDVLKNYAHTQKEEKQALNENAYFEKGEFPIKSLNQNLSNFYEEFSNKFGHPIEMN